MITQMTTLLSLRAPEDFRGAAIFVLRLLRYRSQ